MAHDLLIQNGQAKMMYYGDPPWHGLGTELERPATAAEAIAAAGLDWEVLKVPLAYAPEPNQIEWFPDRFAIVPGAGWKEEQRPALGIVGSAYELLQNREAFSFFDPIVGQDVAVYHTAGVLDGGKRIWILAKLPDDIRVIGDDITRKFLLLSSSHDGESAVQVKFTPIRVVCQNTLSFALHMGETLHVKHTRDIHQRLSEAHRLLDIVWVGYEHVTDAFKAMTQVSLNSSQLAAYTYKVFPDPVDPENEAARVRATRDRTQAEFFFENGKGNDMPKVKGTLWAAYNGIVQYIDYRGIHKTPFTRLNSVWFGTGQRIKSRAFRKAKALCSPHARSEQAV